MQTSSTNTRGILTTWQVMPVAGIACAYVDYIGGYKKGVLNAEAL